MNHTIDATNEKLGRLATKVAVILMGKDQASFVRNQVSTVKVTVTNASKMSVSDKKKDEKIYKKYSGYPGGLKLKKLETVVAKHGYREILKTAVYGMLPKNKLRSRMIMNLSITE